jgi:radical SAM superfamily enzyme YgiQ (UPF0313 family)
MNILFVTTPYIIDPLGIAYLSAIAKKLGHHVSIEHIDSLTNIVPNNWDIIAFSLTTGQHKIYEGVAKQIKSRNNHPIIVWGGPHPTYFPEADPAVDYIVQGEADMSWSQLLKDIDAGIKRERVIMPVPLVQDIDLLPMPDRELIYRFPKNRNNPLRNIITSRGCPFSCAHCYNSSYRALYPNQKIVRTHSINRVIFECEEVKNKWDAKFIFFIDDEFTMNDERLFEFADKYAKQIALPYHAQLRIELLTEKKAKILRDSGCVSLTFAIESGGERYRKEMLHRNMTNQQIIDGAKILHKYGIRFRTENMLGLPYESFPDALNTLNLNIKCRPELAWASLYQPYPGTLLGDICLKNGLLDGSINDIKPSFFEDSILLLPNKRKFVNLQRLFGLIVSFPLLKVLLPILLNLPTNKVYAWLYRMWKTYKYDRKLYRSDW